MTARKSEVKVVNVRNGTGSAALEPFRWLRLRNRTLMLRVTRYNHATLPSAVDRAEI